jgi:hypothetical protein
MQTQRSTSSNPESRYPFLLWPALALTALLAACATPVVTGDATLPVVATLPLHAAHIVDAHVQFTAAFQRELDARLRELGGEPPLTDLIVCHWKGRPDPVW